MKKLQKWFDAMAGVSREEQARHALAQQVFSRREPDMSQLGLPACWRRKRMVSY